MHYRLGAQKPNQTFFMADRMRKQGGNSGNATSFNGITNGGNRPLSIDEMNTTHQGIMLQSTNDSRIHEMLPKMNQTRIGGFGASANNTQGLAVMQ